MQNKGNPVGIRFDNVKLERAFVKSGMTSKQRLVDHLIDMYIIGDNPLPSLPVITAAPKITITKSFDYYSKARIACESAEEWQLLKDEILTSSLSSKQKALLTN